MPHELVTIRPWLTMQAFHWDGQEVEGYQRQAVGMDEFQNPCYHLVAVLLDPDGTPTETFAMPGDWIVISRCGSFVWPERDFAATYEIISPTTIPGPALDREEKADHP